MKFFFALNVLRQNRQLVFELAKPYDRAAKGGHPSVDLQFSNWLGRLDSNQRPAD